MKKICIKDEYVTLGQFLKIADIISTGGDSKFFLSTNEVLINNESDNRRGRKIYKGDTLKILGVTYQVC